MLLHSKYTIKGTFMKKMSKLHLLFCVFSFITITQHTHGFMPEKTLAAVTHHVIIKDLDGKIYEITQKYVQHLTNLSLSNLRDKAVHLENLRQDLLFYINRSEKLTHAHQSLKNALESLNLNNQSLQTLNNLKQVLRLLPETTRNLIKNSIKDTYIKGFLGL